MKNNKMIFAFLMISILLIWTPQGFALEKKTHQTINETISKSTITGFSLNDYLKIQLGFNKGVEETLPKDSDKKTVFEWLAEGGKAEDEPDGLLRAIVNKGRSNNHFHNPLKAWNEAGLDVLFYSGQSSILWAQNPDQNIGGKWSWQDARKYYYEGLTSIDKVTRDRAFGDTFRALGQLMHLVQDTSVPAHVRNDVHLLYNYEKWVEKIQIKERKRFDKFMENPISFDPAILKREANPFAPIPIARIIDTDQYTGSNPEIAFTNAVGIAEYANANFFSEDTISNDKFPYPALPKMDLADYFIPDLRDLNKTVVRQYYIYNGWDELSSYKLTLVSLLQQHVDETVPIHKYKVDYSLDEWVYNDYASLLLPRAVGYSAGLLEYFFRGQLQVTSLPIFFKNNLSYIKLKIKNLTPTKESMMNGQFILTYRYTPKGKASDRSQDVFGRVWAMDGSLFVPCVELKYYEKEGDAMEVFFRMIPVLSISKEEYESIQFMLTFQGTLGKEEGAVIGKYFTPGEVLFGEEWDKGLTGTHAWGHEGVNLFMGNTTNGYSSNIIVGDTLVKDSVRYANVGQSRTNYSWVGVFCCNHDQFKDIFPIPVTRNTSLMFKINQMWINPVPPFPEEASHWQGLWLHFSNGYALQFTQPGQGVYEGDKTGIYSFTLGNNILGNIYDLFAGVGIQIPEGPFSLESISLVQVLFSLGGKLPWEIEYQQHMEIDFIQIIEQKEQ
jgi:hypothetical protein